MNKQYQHILIGILIGFILPLIAGEVIRHLFYSYVTVENITAYPKLYSPFLQWGIVANLVLFFILMQLKKTAIQQGVVISTLILVVIVFAIFIN